MAAVAGTARARDKRVAARVAIGAGEPAAAPDDLPATPAGLLVAAEEEAAPRCAEPVGDPLCQVRSGVAANGKICNMMHSVGPPFRHSRSVAGAQLGRRGNVGPTSFSRAPAPAAAGPAVVRRPRDRAPYIHLPPPSPASAALREAGVASPRGGGLTRMMTPIPNTGKCQLHRTLATAIGTCRWYVADQAG